MILLLFNDQNTKNSARTVHRTTSTRVRPNGQRFARVDWSGPSASCCMPCDRTTGRRPASCHFPETCCVSSLNLRVLVARARARRDSHCLPCLQLQSCTCWPQCLSLLSGAPQFQSRIDALAIATKTAPAARRRRARVS